jgi:hypothetical protein
MLVPQAQLPTVPAHEFTGVLASAITVWTPGNNGAPATQQTSRRTRVVCYYGR